MDEICQYRKFARAKKAGDAEWKMYDLGIVAQPKRQSLIEYGAEMQEHGFCLLDHVAYVPLTDTEADWPIRGRLV